MQHTPIHFDCTFKYEADGSTVCGTQKKLSMYKVLQHDAKKEMKLRCNFFLFQKMKISYEE